MSTYLDIQQRVNTDFLNRWDFPDQTKRSIQATVRRYERKPYWFNETATSIATVASQSYVPLPTNFLVERELRINVFAANDLMTRTSLRGVNDMNTVLVTGQPTHYTYWQNRIELALIPNGVWTLPLYYIKKLPTLSADTDSNSWTTEFEDVIAYGAAKLMWATTLRNDAEAQKYAMLEAEALRDIEGQNEQFKLSGIKPTRF